MHSLKCRAGPTIGESGKQASQVAVAASQQPENVPFAEGQSFVGHMRQWKALSHCQLSLIKINSAGLITVHFMIEALLMSHSRIIP